MHLTIKNVYKKNNNHWIKYSKYLLVLVGHGVSLAGVWSSPIRQDYRLCLTNQILHILLKNNLLSHY